MLNKQVKIYSVDTNSFLTKEEKVLNKKIKDMNNTTQRLKEFTLLNIIENIYNNKITFDGDAETGLRAYRDEKEIEDEKIVKLLFEIKEKNTIVKENKKTKKTTKTFLKPKYNFVDVLDLEEQLKQSKNKKYIKMYIKDLVKNNSEFFKDKSFKKLMEEIEVEIDKKIIQKWKEEFRQLIEKNKDIRTLNYINKYNIVSVFDSFLTRTLGIKENELSEDLITLKIYHHAIFEQLIEKGFIYKNEKYISFTSSAGQIRNEKMEFIKESVWNKYQKTLMCGLTIEDINNNSKEHGCNINKFLAYLALTGSATDEWENFNIDQCVVLEDFETTIKDAKVDYISKTRKIRDVKIKDKDGNYIKNDDGTYKTTKEEYWLLTDKAEPITKDIEITHSDGCGWVLPSKSDKNFQCRLPWIKGLLTPCNYLDWCDEYNDSNYKVTDIYGKEWDLKKDDIKVVFFKSQFKMWKYYKNWDDYKAKFKDNNCKAGKCNVEDDNFKKANFNYQMWQTLENIDDTIIEKFTTPVHKLITKAYSDKNTMLNLLGASKKNPTMNYLQKALVIYPPLLQDKHIKNELSEALNKKKKEAKYGKFKLDAKYTFLIPDVVAWMEYIFTGNKNPEGLLKDGEVYCRLFDIKKYPELLCNRSPHLYKEHCVRNNVFCEDMEKWYCTDGIYTSCHDMISKQLQFDNDGDKSLVIGDKDIIKVAKNNMKDEKEKNIRPLYYEMGKAEPKEINATNIYNSLTTAFKYGNIGEYSNELTRLWNYKKHDSKDNEIKFTEDEIKERLNLAKIITCQNNFSIDAAKTLEMVEVSDVVQKQLNKLNKIKLPYFFKFAKDKKDNQVEKINNSTVNRICKKIENIPQLDYNFGCVGKFNKNMLMNNIKIEINEEVIIKYKELKEEMQKYFRCISNSSYFAEDEETSKERIAPLVYDKMYLDFTEFCKSKNINMIDATDMIIKYIYKTNKDCKKAFLFNVFGDIILTNIKKNVKTKIKKPKVKEGYILCSQCNKEVEKKSNRQTMCPECSADIRKKKDRERKSKK